MLPLAPRCHPHSMEVRPTPLAALLHPTHHHPCGPVRYLDLMRSKEGIQPLQSPLPDIIAMLEHQASAHGSSGDGGSSGGGGSGGEGSPAKGRPQRRLPGGALIYCHRREDVDRVAGALSRRGFACAAYHAGLPDATRARVLEEWRARRLDVVAATVAFGMGVDRAGGWVR